MGANAQAHMPTQHTQVRPQHIHTSSKATNNDMHTHPDGFDPQREHYQGAHQQPDANHGVCYTEGSQSVPVPKKQAPRGTHQRRVHVHVGPSMRRVLSNATWRHSLELVRGLSHEGQVVVIGDRQSVTAIPPNTGSQERESSSNQHLPPSLTTSRPTPTSLLSTTWSSQPECGV
jgi:hypothetical protein